MNVALRRRMTAEAFPAWEERQEERWEFDGFQPMAAAGGTVAHSLIGVNVISRLNERLRGGPCRVIAETVEIMSAESIRYPDVFVVCGAVANEATEVDNPVVPEIATSLPLLGSYEGVIDPA